MISLIACLISYSMFSFTFNYYIGKIHILNLSQAGGVEAEYHNSFSYNLRPSPAAMTSFGVKTDDVNYQSNGHSQQKINPIKCGIILL